MVRKQPTREELVGVCAHFRLGGAVTDIRPCGNGHINSTFIVTATRETGSRRYVLQMVNTDVFKRPEEVMENIGKVTAHIRAGLLRNGEDAERGTLTVIDTVNGKHGYTDAYGSFWRVYTFVEHTVCRLTVEDAATFARVGEAFGDFQRRLADFDASCLAESIPNFHNTKKRYADFLAAVERDAAGRAASVKTEIDFIQNRANACARIVDALADGSLPLRVTHNDAKLSNILLDADSGEAVCIIDLDTVMPGSALFDFGDSIRTGASSAAEDEPDLSRVCFLPAMFEAYTRGFVKGTGGTLTDTELRMLPDGAYVMTLEQAIRFLTDYLDGDAYYHTEYPDHNLIRARTQCKLVADMEAYMPALRNFVEML